jgi:phosphopantothenoylcysteine synthetase/decarboxylase
MSLYKSFNERTRGKFTIGVIGTGIVLALASICGKYVTPAEHKRETIVGAVPVNGDAQEPLYIMDINGDGTADVIMTYPKQALYIASGYKENCGLIVDKNTKTLDNKLRDAATKVIQADQELTDLLHR